MKTKSIIAALILAASSAFAQVPSYVPTNGLVGWWPFNGNINDLSGNGNNGTVFGATPTSDRFGLNNAAYFFDPLISQSNISINTNPNSIATYFSISIWVKPNRAVNFITESSACPGTVSVPMANSNQNWAYIPTALNLGTGISVGTNGVLVAEHSANLLICRMNYSASLSNFTHVVVTYSNDSTKLYVNGNLVKAKPTLCSTLHNLTLGHALGSSLYSPNFSGELDDFGLWTRELTQQEIVSLYNAQSCIGNITADGPTAFCAGNFVNLTSDVVGGTYQWKRNGVNITTNGTSRTYKATSSGSYTCVATCNGTALTSNAIQVTSQTNAAVTLTASGATSFCAGDSITLNATNLGSGYSVQWYRTNISMQGATNYSVVVKQPGTYKTVTRNLANGCSRISSGSIITAVNCRMSNPAIIAVDPVSDEIPTTKLGNSTETTMHLFPNPNAGSFTLEYDGIEADFEVQVVNTMGQVIYNDIIPSNDKHLKTTINLGDNMQKGVYVVRIINGENVQESKVMLQ